MEFNDLLDLVGEEPVFNSALLMAGDVNPRLMRQQLSRWVKSGKVYQLRRGLYALAPPYQKSKPHPFLVANYLQRGSYVSLQSALAHYSLIPEVTYVTTSVSGGRPEKIETPLGVFEFHHVKRELLFGYELQDLGGQSAFYCHARESAPRSDLPAAWRRRRGIPGRATPAKPRPVKIRTSSGLRGEI